MLGYSNKQVLVVGGATGMGAAAARKTSDAGAHVTVIDIAAVDYPIGRVIQADLRDHARVEALIDELDGPFDAVFSCAGVADGTPGILLVNFIAQRRLLEGLLAKGALPKGSAIGIISSTAGLGWEQELPRLRPFLDVADWEGQVRWIAAHKSQDYMASADTYLFSKRAVCAYVATRAYTFFTQGVRLNAVQPGPTDTPLARANPETWLTFASDYRAALGLEHLQPEQMADALLFLCSPMASGIVGENLVVDQGYRISKLLGSFDG